MSTSYDPSSAGDGTDGRGRATAARDEHDTRLDPGTADRHTVVAREKDAYGGIKVGSAFFGWLTATGTAVLLTALLAAAGAAVGLSTGHLGRPRPRARRRRTPGPWASPAASRSC